MDCVTAAVRSGADAVYLGGKEFSARDSAKNFDGEELKEAVQYSHISGVKVYLTLNTLVFDSELEQAAGLIASAATAGIDGLIVQNIGVARLAREIVPQLPLHASTQMSVHSPAGARLLFETGFKRVVLARELSFEEIRNIVQACPIETEVFVHGALCMSVSGQCYMSSVLGSRSGNRGRCAQPCRLPFSVGAEQGRALSLKDNSLIEYIGDLQKIGVTSAKIEGRMKRPEYVAAATAACVQQRDRGFVSPENRERLEKVFSRCGFTDGYYKGERGAEMFGFRRKSDVVCATESLFADIRSTYKDERKRVEIEGEFTAEIGERPLLRLSDGVHQIEEKGRFFCQKAVKKALEKERCKQQLLKTGGTPYSVKSMQISLENGVTMPFSQINSLRRAALQRLSQLRKNGSVYEINEYKLTKNAPYKAKTKKIYCRFTSAKLGKGFKEADLCFVPLFSSREDLERLIKEGFKIGAEIPRAMFSREEKIKARLETLKKLGITDVLCNNLSAVYLAKKAQMKIHGGFGLNFVNTLDLQWAQDYGFTDSELSFELSFRQIEALGGSLPRGIISYGFLPLMLTRSCPNKSGGIRCGDCRGRGKMKDRINKTFNFYCDGCATEILNPALLDVTQTACEAESLDFQLFRFSVENSVENVEKISDFLSYNLNFSERTNGLYLRGIF